MKKILSIFVLLLIVAGISNLKESNTGDLYVGIAYAAAKAGASDEAGLAIGLVGVWSATTQGLAWGAVFGGPAGAIAGAATGL